MRYLAGLAALCGALSLASNALAADVVMTSVEDQGDSAMVHGVVNFPTPGRQSVTADATATGGAAAATPAGDAAGLKMTDALIEPHGDGLRFTWKVDGLPAQTPPEAVRYTWGFQIGNTVYQLQAKRTNLASITTLENPVGHLQQAAAQKNFFQLRGACQASYEGTPTAGCYHLAFLDGAFDATAGTVSIDLPYLPKDPLGRIVAPDFKRGATLVDNGGNGTAGMTISAAFQAVVSNTNTARYFNSVAPYYAGLRVDLAVASKNPGEDLTYTTTVVPNADGSFSAVVPGLGDGARTVHARACNGTTCVTKKVTLP